MLYFLAIIKNLKDFISDTVRTITIVDGVEAIVGQLKTGKTETQSYKFSKNKFKKEQAKAWLSDHGIVAKTIEEPSNILASEAYRLDDTRKVANIYLYGEIDDSGDIDCNDVAMMLRNIPEGVELINIHFSSAGGNVINGMALFGAMMDSEVEIHTYNDGMALSMGGVIMMGGDKIFMRDTANFMIHEPHINGAKVEDLEDGDSKNMLKSIRDQLITIFVKRTDLSRDEITTMMSEETWLNAIQAKEKGIIDEIIETEERNESGNTKAEPWTRAYINSLEDTSFAIIQDGGKKVNGKTEPRSLRQLPYRDNDNKIDVQHLRSALTILAQTKLTSAEKKKASKVLEKARKEIEINNATGITTKNDGHSHAYDIDNNGDGKTTKIDPSDFTPHTHKVEKFVVIPSGNHTHKLAKAKEGTSKAQMSLQASMNRVGSEWEVTVIHEGLAKTIGGDFFLSAEVLKASVECFENIGVYCHAFGKTLDDKYDMRHRPGTMNNPNNLFGNRVGWIDNSKYIRENGKGLIKATFHCVDDSVGNKLKNIWEIDPKQMPQFSVDVPSDAKRVGNVAYVQKLTKANSLDMVTVGAFTDAGFNRLVASSNIQEETMLKKLLNKIFSAFKAGTIKLLDSTEGKTDDEILALIQSSLGAIDETKITDEQIETYSAMTSIEDIKNAITAPSATPVVPVVPVVPQIPKTEDPNIDNRIKKVEDTLKASQISNSENLVLRLLASEQGLGDTITKRIKKAFTGRGDVTESEVVAEIAEWKKDLDVLQASGSVTGMGSIQYGDNEADIVEKRLECMINPSMEGTEGFEKIEGYPTFMQAMLANTPRDRNFIEGKTMQAAARADFPTLFQDVMNKQIRKQYDESKMKSAWSKLVDEVPLSTLDTQHIYDIGGFPFLDTVGGGDDYQELNTPGEEEATYTPTKKGGIFTITEEMMFTAGDKATQMMRLFPKNMASAMNRTLSLFVFNLITGCDGSSGANTQTIYDGTVLYALRDGANNFGTAALDYDTFYAGYVSMTNRTKLSTNAPAEIEPKYLLVPNELLPTASNVVRGEVYPSQTDNGVQIKNPYSALGVEPIGVPNYYLCADTNNWYIIANKNGAPTIQIGYFKNQRVPQIYLQDKDTDGKVFTADKWTYKTKMRWGGAVTDYRGFYSGNVA